MIVIIITVIIVIVILRIVVVIIIASKNADSIAHRGSRRWEATGGADHACKM